MHVVKRCGKIQSVCVDKIAQRIGAMCTGLDADYINPEAIAKSVTGGLYDGIFTSQIDELVLVFSAFSASLRLVCVIGEIK